MEEIEIRMKLLEDGLDAVADRVEMFQNKKKEDTSEIDNHVAIPGSSRSLRKAITGLLSWQNSL